MPRKPPPKPPLGNQYALGNEGGRPPKYDLIKEAADLLAWSERDDALRLYGFTDKKEYLTADLNYFASREPVFSSALRKAKERIAIRREQKCNSGEINTAVYNRTNYVYDHVIDDAEEHKKDLEMFRKMKMIEFEYKMKSNDDEHINELILAKFNAHMAQLSNLQNDRKSDEISNNEDSKS